LNKDSTGSAYGPRTRRTKKNMSVYKIILAATAFLLVISIALYSIYEMQSRSATKQTAEENTPSSIEPIDTDESLNDEPTGTEQTDSTGPADTSTVPDEHATDLAESEISPEDVQEPITNTNQDDGLKASNPNTGNEGNKASASSDKTVKLPTTYTIQKGDTLSTISMKFYHSKQHVALLAEHNNIVFINDMNVGDTIKIPALSSKSTPKKSNDEYYKDKITLPVTYMVQSGDTLYHIAMQFYHSDDYVDLIAEHNKLDKIEDLKAGTNLIIPAIPENQAGNNNSTDKAVTHHTVGKGETLSSISRKYFGDSSFAKTIAKYNHLSNNDVVKIGDVLKIPPVSKP